MFLLSKPLRLRGLKSETHNVLIVGVSVEAFAASWIEILTVRLVSSENESKPLRLRGLKYNSQFTFHWFKRSKPLRLRGLKFEHLR